METWSKSMIRPSRLALVRRPPGTHPPLQAAAGGHQPALAAPSMTTDGTGWPGAELPGRLRTNLSGLTTWCAIGVLGMLTQTRCQAASA